MSRRLFIIAGIIGALAAAVQMLGIWSGDTRWFSTALTLSILFGGVLFAGVFAAIAEDVR